VQHFSTIDDEESKHFMSTHQELDGTCQSKINSCRYKSVHIGNWILHISNGYGTCFNSRV